MPDKQNLIAKQGLKSSAARFACDHLFNTILDCFQPRQCPNLIDICHWVWDDRWSWMQQVRHLGLHRLVLLAERLKWRRCCLRSTAHSLNNKISRHSNYD